MRRRPGWGWGGGGLVGGGQGSPSPFPRRAWGEGAVSRRVPDVGGGLGALCAGGSLALWAG